MGAGMALTGFSLRAVLVASVALGVAGCGNDGATREQAAQLRGLFSRLIPGGGGAGDQPATGSGAVQQQLAGLLASSEEPVVVTAKEGDAATASALVRIEQNGAYDTYATGQRQTMTLRGGMLTATRGLGNDLMSADIDAVQALVRARKDGGAPRRMRYLDGENRTFEFRFDCAVQVGAVQTVPRATGGEQRLTRITERCTSPSRSITNTYMVDATGHVMASSQWAGPLNGNLSITQIRK